MWLRFSILFTLVISIIANSSCPDDRIKDRKYGHTIPCGDIILEHGKDIINITCYITNETTIAERLKNPINSDFVFTIGKEEIPEDQIIRLNETAIRYINKNPDKMEKYISCNYKEDGIAINSVAVGTKPNDVVDFDCLGYNLENFTCSWTKDNRSTFLVNYTLSYHFYVHTLDTHCAKYISDGNKLSCFWDTTHSPYYRTSHDTIHFKLSARNAMGWNNQSFEIDHYSKVKTSPPGNLRLENVTTSSLFLSWEIPELLVKSSVILNHRVMYTFEDSENPRSSEFRVGKYLTTDCESKVIYTNLTHLPFANTLYDVRVSMKLNKSDSEKMWSANATLINRTESTLPGAPIANPGAFCNKGDRIIIYWKQVPKLYQNGPEFKYIIEYKNQGSEYNETTTLSYLELFNLSTSTSHTYHIRSVNKVGVSLNYSTIVVPALDDPEMTMEIPMLKEYGPAKYELSWFPPKNESEHVANYTVYWCESVKVSASHLCSNISWVTVPKTVTSYNITISPNNNIAMAISANGKTKSTTMMWAECIAWHDNRLQMDINVLNPSATQITVTWKFKCSDKTTQIKNFVIEYCTVPDLSGNSCLKGSEMNKTIPVRGTYLDKAVIDNLEPYTTYRIRVLMENIEGTYISSSDVEMITTAEGTPTTPTNLSITDRTNNSISLEWMVHGQNSKVIRSFEIKYNDHTRKIERLLNAQHKEKETHVLTGLLSYQVYNISVKACIERRCSDYSKPVVGQTKIGVPSQIKPISFSSFNNSITWQKPDLPGGRIDYYEVEVIFDGNPSNITVINTTTYALQKCGENSPYSTVSYKVRAVNIGENYEIYPSPWSNAERQKCQKMKDYNNSTLYVVIGFILFAVICIFSIAFGKRCYKYFITMKDVQFQLPDGLYETKDRFPRGNDLDFIKEPQGDDQFLLYDKGGIKRSGDSSGCSSGQDSAESDSGTSLGSSTDSGTEQPRTKDDDVEAVALDDFSLSTSGNNGPYCQLGYSSSHSERNDSKEMTPFSFPKDVSCTSSSDISPYIRCDQIEAMESRPVNPGYVPNPVPTSGYVPHTVEEKKSGYVPHPSAEKNSGYVMAAEKNSFGTGVAAGNKGYVQVAESNPQMINNESPPRTNGYVSYGDVKSLSNPSQNEAKGSSAYVPHKQLDEVLNKTQ